MISAVNIKVVKLNESAALPVYATPGAAGADITASEDRVIPAYSHALIRTGLVFEIPQGFEVQIRPRSGLALKNGVTVLNAPGTIDSDYRGEVGVVLVNHTGLAFTVKKGDRIAQVVVAPVVQGAFESVNEVSGTQRGAGGFGSTGVQS